MESGQRKNMEVNNTISQFIAAQQCWGFGESVINQNNQQAYNTLYALLPSHESSTELTMSAVLSKVVCRKRDKEKASKKEWRRNESVGEKDEQLKKEQA